ncbi:MAG: universal stress protein UspE [Gammaproteobacteria bacterium]|nr:universal stress protein UspE [Gammaproteobacteria bacterium]NVK88874.1 universal stress protein UspE [Gammaproteobacteria bacterium]
MQPVQRILVVITREAPTQPALERALAFAKDTSVTITLLSSVYQPALELTAVIAPDERQAMRLQYLKARQEYLEQLTRDFPHANVEYNCRTVWNKKPSTAILDYLEDHEFDLTIKRISRDASSENPFVMPTDWQLLRFCPTPLLLVKDEQWHTDRPLLAAVSLTQVDSKHQALNQQIIHAAQQLSRQLDCDFHLVSTHATPNLDVPLDYKPLSDKPLRERVNAFHQERMRKLIDEYPLRAEQLHIVEGLAEEQIPLTAQQIGAQLVIMGTVARTGLTAAFMGNTAERVLAQLQCEVLALKPQGFEV